MRDLFRIELAELVDRYDVTSTYSADKIGTQRHQVHAPGLYQQLLDELGERRREFGEKVRGGGKPASRPPGWRPDVSELLLDIQTRVAQHRRNAGLTADLGTEAALRQLPDIATDATLARIAEDVHEWHRLARLTIGYQVPSRSLPDTGCYKRVLVRGGFVDRGCGERSLRIAADMQSEVWCANPACHDDDEHPDCREEHGNLTCRRTERDFRHGYRWTKDEFLKLWQDQERRAKQQRDEEAAR